MASDLTSHLSPLTQTTLTIERFPSCKAITSVLQNWLYPCVHSITMRWCASPGLPSTWRQDNVPAFSGSAVLITTSTKSFRKNRDGSSKRHQNKSSSDGKLILRDIRYFIIINSSLLDFINAKQGCLLVLVFHHYYSCFGAFCYRHPYFLFKFYTCFLLALYTIQ